MNEIKQIFLCKNGNVAVFDEKGEQIFKLQKNLVVEKLKKAQKMGYEIKNAKLHLADGKEYRVIITTDGNINYTELES